MLAQTLALTTKLIDIANRRGAARVLARHFKADDLIIFVRDHEIGVSLPVAGFPQTFPHGALWQSFTKTCIENGTHTGELFMPDKPQTVVAATGFAAPDDSVMILLGGQPNIDEIKETAGSLLILLGAVFRAEKRVVAAEAQLQLSKISTAQTKELAAKLEATRGEFQQALIHAETANRLKDEFLATVSHELRTPLNSILGWASILKTSKTNETMLEKAVATIERNAHAQNQLIEDLLDMSRIITGNFQIESRPVCLINTVLAVIDTLRPATEAKNIQLRTQFDTQTVKVSGDAERLQQIIWNLLSNAVKFTPDGGRIEITITETSESYAQIIVCDTGIGIEPEFLPFVFDRFRQSDSSKSRRHSGLGLGLAIVRQLVELHGGTVEAESEGAGSGTAFIVKLPRYKELPQAVSEKEIDVLTSVRANGNEDKKLGGLRVLFVEDAADSRELLSLFSTNRELWSGKRARRLKLLSFFKRRASMF